MGRIADNLTRIREEIASAAKRGGRSGDDVGLVAVTKTVDLPEVREVVEAGVRIIGENRVQEGERKREGLSGLDVRWDMIGHLQRNKAKQAVECFDFIHSIDSPRIAKEVGKRAVLVGKVIPVLLEANVSGEESKYGFTPERLMSGLESLASIEGIRIEGLMAMAPWEAEPEDTRPVFVALRELADRIRDIKVPGVEMRHLSMGMSNDYVVAVEEGATLVRIGSAIFQ
jgi:pyridoxal phosphate enzyme (YggS family)